MRRPSHRKNDHLKHLSVWSTEQDVYLIEHAEQSLSELAQALPYNEEQILARKKVLGLIQRAKQLKRFHD